MKIEFTADEIMIIHIALLAEKERSAKVSEIFKDKPGDTEKEIYANMLRDVKYCETALAKIITA